MERALNKYSTDTTLKSKRIAANTLTLFVRMFAVMVINLYVLRVILKALGNADYGTYNAVAGIVLASTFLTTTLAVAIQRYYSYAMGEKADFKLKIIFSASINIVLIISLLVFILLETVGLLLLNTQLSIPSDRMEAANWIYQFSIVTFLLSFIQLPFTAAIFAREDMGIFALISLTDCLLRLLVALLISHVQMDSLVFYGLGLLSVAAFTFCVYCLVARHRYSECHYVIVKEKNIHKELVIFSGWTTYSALSGIATTYGITVLLNIFFGSLITAAYAIALQVMHAFQALASSVLLAFRPAMVKAYAEKDMSYLGILFSTSSKVFLYLFLCVSLPIIFEIRTIFRWWLESVSEETIVFSRLCIVYTCCLILCYPITTIVQSTGNLKNYTLWVETLLLACLPVAYGLFKLGLPPYSAMVAMIIVCLLAHAVRLVCMKQVFPVFAVSKYFRSIVVPGFFVAVLSTFFTYYLHQLIDGELTRFIIVFTVSPLLSVMLFFMIGITKTEKTMIYGIIKKHIKGRGMPC